MTGKRFPAAICRRFLIEVHEQVVVEHAIEKGYDSVVGVIEHRERDVNR